MDLERGVLSGVEPAWPVSYPHLLSGEFFLDLLGENSQMSGWGIPGSSILASEAKYGGLCYHDAVPSWG